jgi:hypothetical protein
MQMDSYNLLDLQVQCRKQRHLRSFHLSGSVHKVKSWINGSCLNTPNWYRDVEKGKCIIQAITTVWKATPHIRGWKEKTDYWKWTIAAATLAAKAADVGSNITTSVSSWKATPSLISRSQDDALYRSVWLQ